MLRPKQCIRGYIEVINRSYFLNSAAFCAVSENTPLDTIFSDITSMSLVVVSAGGNYFDVGAYYGKKFTNAMSFSTVITGGYYTNVLFITLV